MWQLVTAIYVQGALSDIGPWRCLPPPVCIYWPIATSTRLHYSLYTFVACLPNRYQGPPWTLDSSWRIDWSGRVLSLHHGAWQVCHQCILVRMNRTWNHLQVGWLASSKFQHPPCMIYSQDVGGNPICDFEMTTRMTSEHRVPGKLGISCLSSLQILVQERSSSFQHLGSRDMNS